jgi:hypothetical protein
LRMAWVSKPNSELFIVYNIIPKPSRRREAVGKLIKIVNYYWFPFGVSFRSKLLCNVWLPLVLMFWKPGIFKRKLCGFSCFVFLYHLLNKTPHGYFLKVLLLQLVRVLLQPQLWKTWFLDVVFKIEIISMALQQLPSILIPSDWRPSFPPYSGRLSTFTRCPLSFLIQMEIVVYSV